MAHEMNPVTIDVFRFEELIRTEQKYRDERDALREIIRLAVKDKTDVSSYVTIPVEQLSLVFSDIGELIEFTVEKNKARENLKARADIEKRIEKEMKLDEKRKESYL